MKSSVENVEFMTLNYCLKNNKRDNKQTTKLYIRDRVECRNKVHDLNNNRKKHKNKNECSMDGVIANGDLLEASDEPGRVATGNGEHCGVLMLTEDTHNSPKDHNWGSIFVIE